MLEKKSNNNDFHIEESPQKTFSTSFKDEVPAKGTKTFTFLLIGITMSSFLSTESVAVVSSDYLEEEYVDLDWDEDDYSPSSNEKPAKVSKRTQTPLETIGSITATSSEDEEEIADNTDDDGSGHQIDDEDLEEGTSKNGVSWDDAWISEGSGQKALGDFGMCLPTMEITPKLLLTA